METINTILDRIRELETVGEDSNKKEEIDSPVSLSLSNRTNVVSKDKLRVIQSSVLRDIKDYLSYTFGPMGSYTKIITGNNKETISSSYSKDGLKVLKSIINSGPIEASIIEELIDITRHVEHEVGDGTTSTVLLASFIFDKLLLIQKKYNIPPYMLSKSFKTVVENIKTEILTNKKQCTIEDIKDICMISTNSDFNISEQITSIYEKYGMDVDLSVNISTNGNTYIKEFDGLTITEGYSDPVFINNKEKQTAEIHNARVYHFVDPIDTMEMISYFEKIIDTNIIEPMEEEETVYPTVIVCPRISRDTSNLLRNLTNILYQFDQNSINKPPILIISNITGTDEEIMDDIANLCGCKSIRKYIDPNVQKKDQENGDAPTIENVVEFYGECEVVIADSNKSKFINPKHMHIYKEDGSVEEDPKYTAMVNFLEAEIAQAEKESETPTTIGKLKRRLSALKANMVEFYVGGVTISERDAIKDLAEDAIKNCKSAAKNGVGYAANYEALRAIYQLENTEIESWKDHTNNINRDILDALFAAYLDIQKVLYSTVCLDEQNINDHIAESLQAGCPYNICFGYLPHLDDLGKNVKCSIMLDINILDTLAKIISLMITSNQCLLQAVQLNNY